jgi:hypothetical protein
MNRFVFPPRAGLWLAGVGVAALAVWAAAAHGPQNRRSTAAVTVQPAATHERAGDAPEGAAAPECAVAHTAIEACPPCPACPGKQATPAGRRTGAAVPATPGSAGMVVAIDPETGELGLPSAEQAAALRPQRTTDGMEGLREIRHGDGAVTIVDLQGRLLEYSVVHIGTDGKVQLRCVHGADQADAALRAPAAPPVNAPQEK